MISVAGKARFRRPYLAPASITGWTSAGVTSSPKSVRTDFATTAGSCFVSVATAWTDAPGSVLYQCAHAIRAERILRAASGCAETQAPDATYAPLRKRVAMPSFGEP